MKQDSYPRFIKSELYKVYLMREMEGKPLQLPKSEEEEQTGKGKKDKKKSKDREAEEKDKEKRRRSLLPLPWNKKTSKQNLKVSSEIRCILDTITVCLYCTYSQHCKEG